MINLQNIKNVDLWDLPRDKNLKILSFVSVGGNFVQLIIGNEKSENDCFVNIPFKEAQIYFNIAFEKFGDVLAVINWELNNYENPDFIVTDNKTIYIDNYFFDALEQSKIRIDYQKYLTEEIIMSYNYWKNCDEFYHWFSGLQISDYYNRYDFKLYDAFSKIKNFWKKINIEKIKQGCQDEFDYFHNNIKEILCLNSTSYWMMLYNSEQDRLTQEFMSKN